MSVALWMATMPPPAFWYFSSAAFSDAVHGSPEVWNITSASKRARSVSLKICEFSVCSDVIPASVIAARSSGVPLSIASVCRNAAVSVKTSTCAGAAGCLSSASGLVDVQPGVLAPISAAAFISGA